MATETTTFPVDGPIVVQVRLHGDVHVEALDGLTETSVVLSPRDSTGDALERTVVELSRSTLVVAGPRGIGLAARLVNRLRDRDTVDARILVPSGSTLRITTMSGDIAVSGSSGDADLATGTAGIRVERIVGNLRLRVGSGDSDVGPVSGSMSAQAGSGSVRIAEVGGGLDCQFGSGNLVAGAAGGSVRSRAGSGDVQVDAVHGDVDVASGSGSITLGLPSGVSARLDVTTGSGQLHTDLPVEQAPAEGARAINVRARTGSGDVRLVRAVSPFDKHTAEKP